jgi:hypothetical protein
MVERTTFRAAQVWIWPYALAVGLWAYWCSRGSDGRLDATVIGFGVLGLLYCILMWFSGRVYAITVLLHMIVMELAVIVALAVNPELDEMGGILNLLIPAFVAGIVVVGCLVRLARSLRAAP